MKMDDLGIWILLNNLIIIYVSLICQTVLLLSWKMDVRLKLQEPNFLILSSKIARLNFTVNN